MGQGVARRVRAGAPMTSRAVLVFLGCLATVAAAGFDLEGHRGARGLMPENTLPAFAKALSLGVDTLELDTGIPKDGVVVISHNRVVEPGITRGPDGAWLTAPGPAIHALTLAELRRYDVGAIRPGTDYYRQFPGRPAVAETRVPTLAELSALLRRSGKSGLRLKDAAQLSPPAAPDTPPPDAFSPAPLRPLLPAGPACRPPDPT